MTPRAYYEKLDKEEILCPLTGSERWEPLVTVDRFGMGISTMINIDSGFVATNPRPTRAALLEFYKNHYRDFYFSFPDPSSKDYQDSKNCEVSKKRAEWLVNFCAEHLRFDYLRTHRVLDVGCADGAFLYSLKHYLRDYSVKFELYGIEPDPNYAAFAKIVTGGMVLTGGLEEQITNPLWCEGDLDLIVMSHVLEHLCDPQLIVKNVYSLLREDGCFLVEVPNILSPCWSGSGMFHIAHINHFYPETLVYLLEQNGFYCEKIFHSVHPVDPWAMTILARKCKKRNKHYDLQNIIGPQLYGSSTLSTVRNFIVRRVEADSSGASVRKKIKSLVRHGYKALIRP